MFCFVCDLTCVIGVLRYVYALVCMTVLIMLVLNQWLVLCVVLCCVNSVCFNAVSNDVIVSVSVYANLCGCFVCCV